MTMVEPRGQVPRRWSDRVVALLAVAAAAAASVRIYGYAVGLHNHSIQIPLVKKLIDPTLYPGDAFVETLRGYFSYFWPMVAWAAGYVPLERLLFVLHLIVTLAQYAAVFAIARRCFPTSRRAAYIALWLYLWGDAIVGGEDLHWFYLTHTSVTATAGLWAIYLFLSNRKACAFVLAGGMFNFHAMQAGYVVWMLLAAHLASSRPLRWRRVLLYLALAAATAAPGVFWMIRSASVASVPDLPALLRSYFPAHFFASSWTAEQCVSLLVFLSMVGISLWRLRPGAQVTALHGFVVAILLLWGVGNVFGDRWSIALVLKMHVFRSSSYLAIIGLVAIAGYLAQRWRQVESSRAPPAIVVVCALGLAWPSQFTLGSLCPSHLRWAVLGCVVPFLCAEGRDWLRSIAAFTCGAVIFGLFCVEGLFANDYLAASTAGLAVMACLVYVRLADLLKPIASVVICAIIAIGVVRGQDKLAATRHEALSWAAPWFDVQRWARKHTDKDTRFLTPPDMEGFRVFSERPVVGEFKDAAAVLWDAQYADYWRRWVRSFRGDPYATDLAIWERFRRQWDLLDASAILELARQYDSDYVVFRRPDWLAWLGGNRFEYDGPIAYQNARFAVAPVPPIPSTRESRGLTESGLGSLDGL